ncbi:hypothetical protein QAD02_000728 [Eretmocerus hayati]|uniref:Uncharacterized protein n=1 Tax=Eretmocerus hayati TaxID=131215 RepID=A0ACC2NGJ6_9HYME|nr:hypothetical protein QAD02_000728 [Eretmocerus hayati]
MGKEVPQVLSALEKARQSKCESNKEARREKRWTRFIKKDGQSSQPDKDYGEVCQKPYMRAQEFHQAKDELVPKLESIHLKKDSFGKRTVLQCLNDEWRENYRQILSASNFEIAAR